MALVFVVGLAILAASYAATSRTASGSTRIATGTYALDHYECYFVKPLQIFKPRRVTLLDQFGFRTALVTSPAELCNPVVKTLPSGVSTPILRKDAHLLCYNQNPANMAPRQDLVMNQFGEGVVNPVQPSLLCLPSGKSLVLTRPAKIPVRFDHYALYITKTVAGFTAPPTVTLQDQFWKVTVKGLPKEPVMMGNPVLKNNPNGQLVNPKDHLVCDAMPTSGLGFKQREVVVTNQFEKAAKYVAYAPAMLCLPSALQQDTPG